VNRFAIGFDVGTKVPTYLRSNGKGKKCNERLALGRAVAPIGAAVFGTPEGVPFRERVFLGIL
jgi:hypothetical protein